MQTLKLALLVFVGFSTVSFALAEENGKHIIFQATSGDTDFLPMTEAHNSYFENEASAKFNGGDCTISYGAKSLGVMVKKGFLAPDGRILDDGYLDIIPLPAQLGLAFELKEGRESAHYTYPSGVEIWYSFSQGALRMFVYEADSKKASVTELGISSNLKSVSYIRKLRGSDVSTKADFTGPKMTLEHLCSSLTN